MIRLATAFSGIGAIEHALNRMGLENEIVFACDNGDVNILTKDVDTDIDEIETELESLSELIEEISINDNVEDLYKNQLEGMLRASMTEFHEVDEQLNNVEEKDNELLKNTTTELLDSNVLKANRKKEYSKRLAKLGKGSFANKRLEEFLLLLAFSNDFRDNNDLLEKAGLTQSVTELLERFENDNGRKLIRRVIDLAQRTSMLHEKINYLRVQRKLDSLGEDWKARKKYVDSLYEGLEKRNKVKASYTANYDIKEDDFHWNIAFLDGKQYAGKVDLFVGGSPCQSFSFVGKQRGLDDTRGTLFYEYARLIDEIRPKVFIYENVRAVTSHDGGKTWKKMQQVFSELDYSFSWKVLNARDYGVPQNRERLFVVGFRNDLDLDVEFSFPQAIELGEPVISTLDKRTTGKEKDNKNIHNDLCVIGYLRHDYYELLSREDLLSEGRTFVFYYYAIKGESVYSHHEDIGKAKYIRFYQNDINATGTYEIEPLKGIIKSRELVSKKQLDDLLTESGSNDGKERSADFYYVLKVEIVSCTEPKISCNNSDLNGVNGNDTFSPHSPKVVTEDWLLVKS